MPSFTPSGACGCCGCTPCAADGQPPTCADGTDATCSGTSYTCADSSTPNCDSNRCTLCDAGTVHKFVQVTFPSGFVDNACSCSGLFNGNTFTLTRINDCGWRLNPSLGSCNYIMNVIFNADTTIHVDLTYGGTITWKSAATSTNCNFSGVHAVYVGGSDTITGGVFCTTAGHGDVIVTAI